MARKVTKKVGKRVSKRSPRKAMKSKSSSKSAGYSKDSMDMAKSTDVMNQPSSRTQTKVREQRKNMNVEHGIKRANVKKHVDTHKKDSVRQKRKQHVRTKRRTKGKHEEEREMVEEM